MKSKISKRSKLQLFGMSLILLGLIFTSCSVTSCAVQPQLERYEMKFFDLFDTASSIQGFAEDQASFDAEARLIYDDLRMAHRLFDSHKSYQGIKNVTYLNEHASESPVDVSPLLFELVEMALNYYEITDGAFNPGLGTATRRWEKARREELPPEADELAAMLDHIDPDVVILDKAKQSIFFEDPAFRLDLGAIAKGFAAEYAAQEAEARGATGILLNLGGNLRTIGHKDGTSLDEETDVAWRIGVRDPRGKAGNPIQAFNLLEGSFVTSGDYERVFVYEGKRYHHILNPETLWPAEGYQAVTIYHPDSGIADVLSTAFFNLSPEEGAELVQAEGGEAFWILADGSEGETAGLDRMR